MALKGLEYIYRKEIACDMQVEMQKYRIKSVLSKMAVVIVAFVMSFFCYSVNVKADNGSISVSSVTGTKGETVTVAVTVSADEAAMGEIGISYDTNYLEYVNDGTNGGVAGLVLTVLNDIAANQPQTINLSFVLKEAGTTNVTVASNTKLLAINASDPENAGMNVSSSNGTVTINAANTASNDSHLSGLTVSAVSQNGDSTNVGFIPGFSPDVYEYTAELAPNVTRLVVATTLSDAKATTQVSGTRIDVGSNKTTITVTAEDGSQSVYTIYTVRPSEATTTAPTDTSEGETAEGETTQAEEPVTEFDRTPKLVENLGKYIIQDFTLISIPEGFEENTAQYAGQTIAVLKGISKGLTLVALADDVQGSNVAIYIYNEASGSFDKMVNVTSTQKIYTVIPTDDSYAGPEGYTKTELNLNGEKVKAWVKKEETEFYVIYAMNWNGETALYVYDTKEQTMQRFVEGNKSENFVDEPETENTEYVSMKRQYDELNDKYDDAKAKSGRIIKVLAGIVIIILLLVAFLVYKIVAGNHHTYLLPEEGDDKKEDNPQNDSIKYPQTSKNTDSTKSEEIGISEMAKKAEDVSGGAIVRSTDKTEKVNPINDKMSVSSSDTDSKKTEDAQENHRSLWDTVSVKLPSEKELEEKKKKEEAEEQKVIQKEEKKVEKKETQKADKKEEKKKTARTDNGQESSGAQESQNNLYFVTAELDSARISKLSEKNRVERRKAKETERNNQRVKNGDAEIGLIDLEDDSDLGIEFVDLDDK